MKIFFSDDDKLTEEKVLDRCCRSDVIVEIEGKYYHPDIIMPIRLVQEIDLAVQSGEPYLNDTCQIIVEAVDKQ